MTAIAKEPSQFEPITFDKERLKLLSDLQTKKISPLGGLSHDQKRFQFQLRHVTGDMLYLSVIGLDGKPLQPPLEAKQNIQLVFGLAEGLYLVRTTIDAANPREVVVPFGQDVHRLQRRNNFRADVPSNYKLDFKLTSYKTGTEFKGVALTALDVSAGGMRVQWPMPPLPHPKEGDHLTGNLSLTANKQMELFALVRSVIARPEGVQVGLEFQNLSVSNEQALLFICLELHRLQNPRLRA